MRQHGLDAVTNSQVRDTKVAASLAAWVQDRDVTGTQFTCFTSTKVQILTSISMCDSSHSSAGRYGAATRAGTQFTCFTGTKVQMLTAALAQLGAERLWKLLWRLQDKDKDLIASYASTSQSRAAYPHAAKAASNSTRAPMSLPAGLPSSK